ncbi:MAG: Rnase Y domain-containing protein, partial [candidate division KSB1 bacterium]
MTPIIINLIVAVAAFVVAYLLASVFIKSKIAKSKGLAEDLLEEARKKAEREKQQILMKAKEESLRVRDEQENKIKQRQRKIDEAEARVEERDKKLARREDGLKQREQQLGQRENEIETHRLALRAKDHELEKLVAQQNLELAKITQLSVEDAKQLLLDNLRQDFNKEAAEIYKSIIDESKNNAVREAKRILTMTIERIASEHASETSVSVVPIPSEEVKGRIIGREGRNIKAFELATGVKVIVDDTPEAVVLSAFDPVKREVARLALEKLIGNGKIHPQRVEEIVAQCEQEVEKQIWRAGNEAVASVGVGKVHPELIRMLGRLYFRSSYGQNVLSHSQEVAYICGAMAAE